MSDTVERPVDKILATIEERGTLGTEATLFARYADLATSDILAAIFEMSDGDSRIKDLAMVVAERAEPDAHRRACALIDPTFTFADPQPVAA